MVWHVEFSFNLWIHFTIWPILLEPLDGCTTKDEECGKGKMFDVNLSNSAAEFKEAYEKDYKNALVWDSLSNWHLHFLFLPQRMCWQNIVPLVFAQLQMSKDLSQNPEKKRARVSTSTGSLPTFTTSSSCLRFDCTCRGEPSFAMFLWERFNQKGLGTC